MAIHSERNFIQEKNHFTFVIILLCKFIMSRKKIKWLYSFMLFRNKFYYSFLSQDASASHQLDFVNKDKQYFQYNIQPRRNVVPMHYKSHCQLHLWWLHLFTSCIVRPNFPAKHTTRLINSIFSTTFNIQPRWNVVPMHYKSHCRLHLLWLHIPLYFLYCQLSGPIFLMQAKHNTKLIIFSTTFNPDGMWCWCILYVTVDSTSRAMLQTV